MMTYTVTYTSKQPSVHITTAHCSRFIMLLAQSQPEEHLLLERDTASISIIAVRSPSKTAEGDLTRVNTEKVANMVQTRRGMNLFQGSTTKESTMLHGRC